MAKLFVKEQNKVFKKMQNKINAKLPKSVEERDQNGDNSYARHIKTTPTNTHTSVTHVCQLREHISTQMTHTRTRAQKLRHRQPSHAKSHCRTSQVHRYTPITYIPSPRTYTHM